MLCYGLVLVVMCGCAVVAVDAAAATERQPRFAAFDPPRITPDSDTQTVKAGSGYTFSCEGGVGRGVSWRLPVDADDDLRSAPGGRYSSELTLRDLRYNDTGSFVCAYNGTVDTSSVDNSTKVHLYVEDPNHLLKQSGVEFLQLVQSQTVILPCQPTHPSVNVTLIRDGVGIVELGERVAFDPKVGFRISPVTFEQHSGTFKCVASSPRSHPRTQNFTLILDVLLETSYVPPPFINRTRSSVGLGDSFSLSCSVTVDYGVLVELSWSTTPNARAALERRIIAKEQTARNLSLGGTHLTLIEKTLTVSDAALDDQGSYECTVVDHSGNTQRKTEFVRILEREEPFLRLYLEGYQSIEREVGTDKARKEEKVKWVVQIESHPKPTVVWYGPNGQTIPDPSSPYPSSDFTVRSNLEHRNAHTVLTVNRVSLETAGTYRCVATNGDIVQEEKFTLVVKAPPKTTAAIVKKQPFFYQKGEEYTAKCSASGFPLPRVSWLFKPCSSFADCDNSRKRALTHLLETKPAPYRIDSTLKHVARESGQIICMACNGIGGHGCQNIFLPFFVSDVANGFDLEGPRKVVEGENIKLRCSASVESPSDIVWYKHTVNGERQLEEGTGGEDEGLYRIFATSTAFSFSKELSFSNVSLMDKGRYICRVKLQKNPYDSGKELNLDEEEVAPSRALPNYYNDASVSSSSSSKSGFDRKELSLDLIVLPLEFPTFSSSSLQGGQTVVRQAEDGVQLECRTTGRPKPSLEWTLNGKPLQLTTNTTRVQLVEEDQVLQISYLTHVYEGLYECTAKNKMGTIKARQIVTLRATLDNDTFYANISYPIVVAAVVAVVLVVVLLLLAKLCFSRCCCSCCGSKFKSPPSPPTPRLKQFELPFDRTMDEMEDDDDCRMTLTSRGGGSSIVSPSYRGGGNSVVSHCHCHYSACPSQMGTLNRGHHMSPAFNPKCSICDFGAALPMSRMATLKRYEHCGGTYRSGSMSPTLGVAPRLSAEF